MEFLIADTFTDSLARLTGQEQKAVKTTAFDLQLDPAGPGLHYHKLDRAKDPCFCSVRVNTDIRLIVHRTGTSLLLAYAGHHDDAYAWAERRKIERHPQTGAAQLVEVRERVEEVVRSAPRPTAAAELTKARLFDAVPDATLLAYGVPEEWLEDARQATEEHAVRPRPASAAGSSRGAAEPRHRHHTTAANPCTHHDRSLRAPRCTATVPRGDGLRRA